MDVFERLLTEKNRDKEAKGAMHGFSAIENCGGSRLAPVDDKVII